MPQGNQDANDSAPDLHRSIHFGLAAGCWLSLDGKDGGDLVKRDGIWEAQRRPEGLKVLAAAFAAARDGGDFALPLMVNKLKEAGK